MSKTLAYGGVLLNKKAMIAIAIAASVLFVAGVVYFSAQKAVAVAPADYGLTEGDTVSAAGSDDPDVYIVNELGYKRLFLNPAIFGFYGHLGGFAKVKSVSPATRDAFPTSGLFRNCETNDEKVYGVETTGEDTGMLHWVNTTGAQAVADDADFFKKVFCINSNEFNWYSKGSDYASVNDVPSYARVPGETPATPGAISVSVAPGNPAASTITKNAQGIEFLRFRLSGTGTLSSLTVRRNGAGVVADFANVYVYEGAKRLTSGKSLSSATGEVTFISLNTAISGTKDLSIVADMPTGNATVGDVHYLSIVAMVLDSGTVSGLPVAGNTMTVSGAESGTLTVNKVGSIPNPNVGQKQAQATEFKLTTSTEAASIKRITLLQGGTVKPADITNIVMKTGTNEWTGTIDSGGYMVFDMGSGFTIAKGDSKIFKVYADLAGKKDEDVNLYFENATDILGVGDQFGFGMETTITELDTAAESFDVTLQGGVLTIAFNGPSASNIGTNTSDTVLLRYSMTAATNIEVRKTKWVLCSDDDASGVFDDSDAGEDETQWDDLTDFKVVDEDSGVTIMGPKDGTAFDDGNNSNASCSATADGAMEYFTDVYELAAGKTYNFKVTADINTANGGFLDSGDAIKVVLVNFTAATGLAGSPATADVTVMKYSGTTTAVADADIVPQADIAGSVMTLQASSLTLGLSSAINDQEFVRGTKDVNSVGITFQAAQASDLKVTDIVLTGYFDENNSGDFSVGSDGTTSVADLVSSVSIYEIESGTVLSSSPSSNQLSNTTGTVTYNNLSWTIPAGATRTLGVRVNLGTNTMADTDYFAFDVNATSDVTALDVNSKTVNAGNADPNGGATPTIVVTVRNEGSMSVANHPDTPSDHAVYQGQTGDIAGKWRFSALYEGFNIEKVQFGEDDTGGTQETDLATNAKAVYLEYTNKAGDLLTASGAMSNVGTVSFGFTGDNRPFVPKDGSLNVTLKIDYKPRAEGATSNKTWDLAFIGDSGTGTNTFKAVGDGSGTVLQGNSTGITNQDSSTDIYIYRVFPEFALVAPTSTSLNTVDPVLKFTITAKGLSDSKLLFDNVANGSGSIKFEVVASGVGDNNVAVTVRDAADNSTVDTETITSATLTAPHASLTINFSSKDLEISGGSSKTLTVTLDSVAYFNTPVATSAGVGADYFQLVLYDNEDSLIKWVDGSTGAASSTNEVQTASTLGYLRLLPMAGYQFKAQ